VTSPLFASQFQVSQPYTPDRLRTGTISVGANLPRFPEDKTPSEGPTDTKPPTGTKNSSGKSASVKSSSGLSAGAGAGAVAAGALSGAGAGKKNLLGQSQQYIPGVSMPGTEPVSGNSFYSLTHVQNPTSGADPGIHTTSTPDQGIYGRLAGGTSAPGTQPASSNPLSGLGHWAAHTFDSARHGVAAGADAANNYLSNPNTSVSKIMNFGNPFPKGSPGNYGPIFQTQQMKRQQAAAKPATVPGVQPDLWNVPSKTTGVGSSQASSAVDHGPYVETPQQVNASQFSGSKSAAPSSGADAGSSWISDVESFLEKAASAGAEAA
jgi:hypothetical protein